MQQQQTVVVVVVVQGVYTSSTQMVSWTHLRLLQQKSWPWAVPVRSPRQRHEQQVVEVVVVAAVMVLGLLLGVCWALGACPWLPWTSGLHSHR